jgi:hypothetical protein
MTKTTKLAKNAIKVVLEDKGDINITDKRATRQRPHRRSSARIRAGMVGRGAGLGLALALVPQVASEGGQAYDRSKLVTELHDEGPKAVDRYFNHEYDDRPVTAVNVGEYATGWEAAEDIARDGKEAEVRNLMSHEADPKAATRYVVLPVDALKPHVHHVPSLPDDQGIQVR